MIDAAIRRRASALTEGPWVKGVADTSGDAALSPTVLCAATVKLYSVPLFRPEMVTWVMLMLLAKAPSW